MKAADKVDKDFQIIIQPDMTTLNDESPAAIATAVDQLAAYPAAARLPDGRLIVSPFKAEAFNAAWWGSWLTTMKNTHGENVAFVPTFLDWRKNMDPFNSISYGFSAWGERSPAQVSSLHRCGRQGARARQDLDGAGRRPGRPAEPEHVLGGRQHRDAARELGQRHRRQGRLGAHPVLERLLARTPRWRRPPTTGGRSWTCPPTG